MVIPDSINFDVNKGRLVLKTILSYPFHNLQSSLTTARGKNNPALNLALEENLRPCLRFSETCKQALQDGQDKYIFFSTNEERRIKDTLTCKSKNLIYLIECKKCATRNLPCQYIGETKRHLHERFGEHRRSVQNHQQLANPTPVSEHFNLPGHSVNDIRLIPLELIHTNRDSVRKAREAHLIDKAKTLEPQGLDRRDELH